MPRSPAPFPVEQQSYRSIMYQSRFPSKNICAVFIFIRVTCHILSSRKTLPLMKFGGILFRSSFFPAIVESRWETEITGLIGEQFSARRFTQGKWLDKWFDWKGEFYSCFQSPPCRNGECRMLFLHCISVTSATTIWRVENTNRSMTTMFLFQRPPKFGIFQK